MSSFVVAIVMKPRSRQSVRLLAWLAVLCALVAACSSTRSERSASQTPSPSTSSTGADARPFMFTVRHMEFVDTARATAKPGDPAYDPRRTLPTDVYVPNASGPRPLIVFSHGYHGAPSKFTELFSAWARAGYLVAAPQFPLTSDRGAPFDEVGDYLNQPGDISFVVTQLLDSQLRGQIDPSRVGAAGLSLGGATTYGLVEASCCRDPRIRAAAIFDGVRLPFSGPLGQNSVPLFIAHIDTDEAAPYAMAEQGFADAASPKWFLTFFGGIHPEAYENTPSPHDLTATQTSIDFFDLTLLGDSSAGARLLRDGDNPGESRIVAG
jgi:predicted dienelactone hydrolase